MNQLQLTALPGVPEIRPGDDLGVVVCDGLVAAGISPQPHDVLAIAQKIVSKAENRFVNLEMIIPTAEAEEVAQKTGKDPRLVTVILGEAAGISRWREGVLITRHRLGFVSANSGIDRSNVPQGDSGEWVLLLPEDPDGTAQAIRQAVFDRFGVAVGIVITDTHGRPHRLGTIGVAIGVAGLTPVVDKRGTVDRDGYVLHATTLAVADEIAAAASLVMGATTESIPIVHLRGLTLTGDGRASDQYRSADRDLYG